jgi:hypothetical protein
MNIPNTSTTLVFLHVPLLPLDSHGQKPQPLLYYKHGEGKLNLASINPGNSYDLYVGGGGGNKAFYELMDNAGQKKVYGGTDDYKARHLALVAKANQAGGNGAASEIYKDTDPMRFSYVRATRLSTKTYEGVCFVDVFDAKHCPYGDPLNSTMLYAAPPDGRNYPVEADFLRDITATAKCAIQTVAEYNALAKQQGVPPVEALRSCLYSSAIYNPNPKTDKSLPQGWRPKTDLGVIARAIYAGFAAELVAQNGAGLSELHLPYRDDPHDPLFAAVYADLNNSN